MKDKKMAYILSKIGSRYKRTSVLAQKLMAKELGPEIDRVLKGAAKLKPKLNGFSIPFDFGGSDDENGKSCCGGSCGCA